MEEYANIVSMIALIFGASWASGINLYATILTLGIMNASGYIALPEDLQILSSPFVLMAAGVMYFFEFFADKIPGVDNMWDGVHSFIRIPFGAYLAFGITNEHDTAIALAAAIIGGGISAVSHTAKTGTRLVANTSPEPFSNWFLSIGEDIAVIVGIWTAVKNPVLFLILFILFILFMIWFLPKVWRGVRNVFLTLVNIVRKKDPQKEQPKVK